MREVLYLYFDEGGNFDFSPRGTAFFVMTCVVMTRPFRTHKQLLEVKYDCLEKGLSVERFHASEDREAVRSLVFEAISNHLEDYACYSVIIRKNMTNPALRDPSTIYSRVFAWLVKYVCPREVGGCTTSVVAITDAIPVQKKRKSVEKAVKANLKCYLPDGVPYRLYHHSSRSDLNLQIADYFNWAVFRKWERNDHRAYEVVRGAIKSEGDLFAGGDRKYY